MTAKPIRLRPFFEKDFGTKPHGWRQEGLIDKLLGRFNGFVNDAGWGLLHVVQQGLKDGAYADQYDQFKLFESPGSILVCLDEDGRVGLVENFRMTGLRPQRILDLCRNEATGKYEYGRYVKIIRERNLWGELLETLGEMVPELPRGMAAVSADDLPDFAKAVAKREGLEEAGFRLKDLEVAGMLNANTTFFPHAQYVVSAIIAGTGANSPEAHEKIGKVTMYAPKQLRQMAAAGKLVDGMTLGALALVGYEF